MKNIFILFLVFSFCFNTNAQDIITLRNRKVIHVYITEKSDTKIKYVTDSVNNIDTTYSMELSGIKTIRYSNGEVDLLSSQNPRSIFPLGVNVGGDLFFGLILFDGSVDYLFTPNISAEINYRSMLTNSYPAFSVFSIGGKYWFKNKYSESGFSPFIGLFFTRLRSKNDEDEILWHNKPEWSIINLPEVPIGVSYITKFGLQTSFQMSLPFLCPEFRIGWRFKTGKK